MRRRGWARKVERYCCNTITYFPLVFVYGLTSWACWVEAGIGFVPSKNAWTGAYSYPEARHHMPHVSCAMRNVRMLRGMGDGDTIC